MRGVRSLLNKLINKYVLYIVALTMSFLPIVQHENLMLLTRDT